MTTEWKKDRREDGTMLFFPVGELPGSWVEDAKCQQDNKVGPNFFITDARDRNAVREIKDYCKGTWDGHKCPVLGSCLEFAMEHPQPGIWGGTTEQDRNRLRGEREKRRLRVQDRERRARAG